jgi:hypothetical protein
VGGGFGRGLGYGCERSENARWSVSARGVGMGVR